MLCKLDKFMQKEFCVFLCSLRESEKNLLAWLDLLNCKQ